MKKNVFLGLLVIGLVIVFFGCDSIQSSKEKQPSSDAERIVGFWRNINNRIVFEFRSNDVYTIKKWPSNKPDGLEDVGEYMVSNFKLILYNKYDDIYIENYYLSDNGRFLVFPYEYYGVKQNIWFYRTNENSITGTTPGPLFYNPE